MIKHLWISTGCFTKMEKSNLAINQLKIDINPLWRWFFCTTEWDILIFRLLNDLNCTLNGYFTPLLEEKFFEKIGGSSIQVLKKKYSTFGGKNLSNGRKFVNSGSYPIWSSDNKLPSRIWFRSIGPKTAELWTKTYGCERFCNVVSLL